MKIIEQEIRERLAAENLSPENVEAAMVWIKADPLMRGMRWEWGNALCVYCPQFIESTWISAWSSARDWILQQITAPVTKEGE